LLILSPKVSSVPSEVQQRADNHAAIVCIRLCMTYSLL
jgi:hypothetical protein